MNKPLWQSMPTIRMKWNNEYEGAFKKKLSNAIQLQRTVTAKG